MERVLVAMVQEKRYLIAKNAMVLVHLRGLAEFVKAQVFSIYQQNPVYPVMVQESIIQNPVSVAMAQEFT